MKFNSFKMDVKNNTGFLGLIVIGIVLANPVYADVINDCYNSSGTEYCYHYDYTCNYSAILTENFSNLSKGTCSFYGKTTVNGTVQSEYNYTWNISDDKGVIKGCTTFTGYPTEYPGNGEYPPDNGEYPGGGEYPSSSSENEYCYYYNWTCDYSAILTGDFSNLPNGTCSFYSRTTMNGEVQSEYNYTWNISDDKGVVEGCYNSFGTEYCYYYIWTCDYSTIHSAMLTKNFSNLPNGTCSFYSRTTMNGVVQSEYNYTWNISDDKGVIEGCYNLSGNVYCDHYIWTCDYSTIHSAMLTKNFSNLPNGCSYYSVTTLNGVIQNEYEYNYSGSRLSLFLYYCDDDNDSYFSRFISGYCFGYNPGCVPEGCSLSKGNDCNDHNASIHPNANEVTCNGIDEDCDGSDKCGKRVWSSDMDGMEKNTFYSYEKVYATGTGFNPNSEIDVYVVPCGSKNLNNYTNKTSVTTDENGNFKVFLWHLPAWYDLSSDPSCYDIIVDENLNGAYDNNEAIDTPYFYSCGFCVDPVWASDENGNPKDVFCGNEKIYANGGGLSVNNTNISLFVVPDMNLPVGTNLTNMNFTPIKTVYVNENRDFSSIVDLGYLPPGEYDIIPDMNNNNILDDNEKKAMDDSNTTGFSVRFPYDFDNNNVVDIFDIVDALGYLSGQENSTTYCDLNNNGEMDFDDVIHAISLEEMVFIFTSEEELHIPEYK